MNPMQVKRRFLRRVADFQPLQLLLDLLPDVAFFMKDRQSRFVMNNRRGFECCGVSSEAETIGKRGYEFFAEDLMAMYLEQDEQVMRTGQPIINRICPAPVKGSDRLIIYSKVPLRDRRQRVIGLAGIWREVDLRRAPAPQVRKFSRAVDLIHQQHAQPLTVKQLARAACLSRSQFTRQFRRLFGAAPHEYLLRVRVNAACRLLAETDAKTTDIAVSTGFYDHSHFARTFRAFMGVSPTGYRRRHR